VQDKALSDLTLATGRQQQQIADNATGTAQALRKQVEDARQSAIDQLYQTADPSQALRGATATAAQFKIPQTFTPLLNAFSGIANQYAMNQLFNNYNPQMYSNPYALPSQQGRIGPTTY
jgi:hypothetical protein